MAISSFVQNTLEPLETVLAKRYPMFEDDLEGIEKVLALYAGRKRERQLMDYDDLLAYWLQLLLEEDEVRKHQRDSGDDCRSSGVEISQSDSGGG